MTGAVQNPQTNVNQGPATQQSTQQPSPQTLPGSQSITSFRVAAAQAERHTRQHLREEAGLFTEQFAGKIFFEHRHTAVASLVSETLGSQRRLHC